MKTFLKIMALLAFLTGCAENIKPEAPQYFNSIGETANALAGNIARQLPSHVSGEQVLVDEVVNETSAEIPISSLQLQNSLIGALAQALPKLGFRPLSTSNLGTAKWTLLTSFRPAEAVNQQKTWLRVRTALVETNSGKRIAYAEAYLSNKAFDVTPNRYFGDVPIYNVNDPAFRAKLKSMEGVGTGALGEILKLSAKYAEAIAYYNDGQFAIAGDKFSEVLAVAPTHLGALSGLYQSYWQRGLKLEAEQTFKRFAKVSIETGGVATKLLFSVGSADFVPYRNWVEQYAIWQKSLAQEANAQKKCLNVVGHASKTGKESFNQTLSLERALRITSNMMQLVPGIKGKLNAVGKGSSQTIVGIGTDDARDAIDRRVEFLVRPCS